MKIRPERVATLMRREVADILRNKLRDPRLSEWVSVTDVEVTADLSSAKIFVSILPTGDERDKALRALSGAVGFVRRELAPRLGLREVPDIRFKLDSSIERGARVEDLLKRLERGEPLVDDVPEYQPGLKPSAAAAAATGEAPSGGSDDAASDASDGEPGGEPDDDSEDEPSDGAKA